MIETWFVLALFSILFLGFAEFTASLVFKADESFDEKASLAVSFALMVPFTLIPYFIYYDYSHDLPNLLEYWYYPLITAILATIAVNFYFKSFKVENVSVSILFATISAIFTTIFGIFFFNEDSSYIKILGIFFILLSLVIIHFKNSKIEKNNYFALIAGLFYGVIYTLDKAAVLNINPLLYLGITTGLMAIIQIIIAPKTIIDTLKNTNILATKFLLASSLFYILYNSVTFYSYTYGGEVGKIDALNNSQVFLIIFLEMIFLKQKDELLRKFFAASLMIIGVLILGML